MTRLGIYTDIAPHPEGGFIQATLGADWRTVTVEWVRTTGERTPVWGHLLPSSCNFLRVAVSPQGDVIVVGQDGRDGTGPNGALWILTAGAAVSVAGYGFGQYGAVVEWWEDGDAFVVSGARRHDYGVAFVTRDGEIGPFVNRPFPEAIAAQGGTSQGWLDVLDGQLVWTDLARLWPSQHDHKLTCPCTRHGVTVGQSPGELHGMRAYGPGIASELTAEDVFEARVAYDPVSGVYAVCARMLNFRTLFLVCPPWPAIVTAPVSVATFPRPCWLLPFHATRHGLSVASPGHAEIITDGQDAGARVSRRPVIVDMASEPSADDVLAIFVALGRDDIGHARLAADRRGAPLMAYWDHISDIPSQPGLRPGWDWLSVMLYCDPTESLEAFRRRARGQVERASGRGFSLVLTVQMFDRNGTEQDLAKLSAMQAIWRELAEAYPDVIGLAPFAVIRGEHGVTAYPFLSEWLSAYAAAMTAPARPVLPVAPPVELPRLGVTIDHYTAGGAAPYRLTVDYHVEGHGHAPVQVYLTLDGQRVAMETDPAGVLEVAIDTPGEYLLGAVVDCAGRSAPTGAVRFVRVTPAPVVPPPIEEDPSIRLIRTAATDGVAQLYRDVLGRPATPEELKFYVDEILANRLDLPGMRRDLEKD